MTLSCRLCDAEDVRLHSEINELPFYECLVCGLIFKHPSFFPTSEQELKKYRQHTNDPQEKGYRDFLLRLVEPLCQRLKKNDCGLDFGCGTTKAVELLFAEKNINCESFDPYFFNNQKLLGQKYSFVTCSEVVEHFFNPGLEFNRLDSLLKRQGWLAVMTQSPPVDFANWWYHRDPTHVVFYTRKSLDWIAAKYNYNVDYLDFGVTLFEKTDDTRSSNA